MKNVLFLCTGNSCRSIMAEGLLKHLGERRYRSFSAGSFPTGEVHPMSIATLKRHGMTPDGFESKSWDAFKDVEMHIVITVCDNAAGEVCPIFPGVPLKAHWGVPDPAHVEGTPTRIEAEFDRVYAMLERRIKAFLELPDTLSDEELQSELQKIGGMK